MTDSILFLGTSGGKEVTEKQLLASGGIIIRSDEHQIHIDPGPGALVMAKHFGVDLRKNTFVLVSHNHINHVNDLNAVIATMTHSGIDRQGILLTAESVVHGLKDEQENYIIKPYLTKYHKKALEDIKILKPKKNFILEDIEIKALRAIHSDTKAIGFKIITPGFSMVYSGDTEINNDIITQYKGAEIFILNVQHPPSIKERGNMNIDDVIKIIKKNPPKLLILNHFKSRFLKQDLLYESRRLKKEFGVDTIIAKEGMIINPKTYSANLKQKTLFMYR